MLTTIYKIPDAAKRRNKMKAKLLASLSLTVCPQCDLSLPVFMWCSCAIMHNPRNGYSFTGDHSDTHFINHSGRQQTVYS